MIFRRREGFNSISCVPGRACRYSFMDAFSDLSKIPILKSMASYRYPLCSAVDDLPDRNAAYFKLPNWHLNGCFLIVLCQFCRKNSLFVSLY